MTDVSKNRQRLWHSLEMGVIRRDLILYTLIIGIANALFSCRINYMDDSNRLTISIVFAAIFLLPIWGFYLWRIIGIFRKAQNYRFFRSKLSQPHQRFLTETMYFTVVLEYPDGGKIVRETHAIFPCHGLVGPLMEDYVNSTVTIAYNEETEMVVVIG